MYAFAVCLRALHGLRKTVNLRCRQPQALVDAFHGGGLCFLNMEGAVPALRWRFARA